MLVPGFVVRALPDQVSFGDALGMAGTLGKLNLIDFSPRLETRYTFWSGLTGGTFVALALSGLRQDKDCALLARAVAQTYEHLTQGRPAPNWNHWDMAPVVEEDLQQQNPLRLARHATFWREQLKNTRDNSVMSLAPPLPLAPTVRQAHTDVPPELHTAWRQAAARESECAIGSRRPPFFIGRRFSVPSKQSS